jgi:hypothetical protein
VADVNRILDPCLLSRTRTWVQFFEACEALNPGVEVPGQGSVTTLTRVQQDTGNLPKALRARMGKASKRARA